MSVRRSEIPQLALDVRHAGELLLQECTCATRTHRWRRYACSYSVLDTAGPQVVVHRCSAGRITAGSTVVDCPECWVSCSGGFYLDPEDGELRPCPLCRVHTLAEHLDRQAETLRPGPRAANTDAGGGHRYERDGDEVAPVPNDSTGEAAIDPLADTDAAEWRAILAEGQAWQRRAHDYINAHRPDRRADAKDPASDAEWCRHHLVTLGTCEPRYRGDLCQTCYRFDRIHKMLPPKGLLEIRHEGRRWTPKMVADAVLAARPAPAGKGKRNRRKGR